MALFFLQNVFMQKTYEPVEYVLTIESLEHLEEQGVESAQLENILFKDYENGVLFKKALEKIIPNITEWERNIIFEATCVVDLEISSELIQNLAEQSVDKIDIEILTSLDGRTFLYKWQFMEAFNIAMVEIGKKYDSVIIDEDVTHVFTAVVKAFKKLKQ